MPAKIPTPVIKAHHLSVSGLPAKGKKQDVGMLFGDSYDFADLPPTAGELPEKAREGRELLFTLSTYVPWLDRPNLDIVDREGIEVEYSGTRMYVTGRDYTQLLVYYQQLMNQVLDNVLMREMRKAMGDT